MRVHPTRQDSELGVPEIANLVGRSKKVVCVTGAGISTGAGIPDFRSCDGLYSPDEGLSLWRGNVSHGSNTPKVRRKDLFHVMALTDPTTRPAFLKFHTSFRQKAKDSKPTRTHEFIYALHKSGRLIREYTQNIDQLQKKVGLCTDLQRGPGSRARPRKQQARNDSANSARKRECSDDDGGVDCVLLHGSLGALRCSYCYHSTHWDEKLEAVTLSGEQPPCSRCYSDNEARQARGKRPVKTGGLRPDILLYGEENRQAELISTIVHHDLLAGPDLLLVIGTSLHVPGVKDIVKTFAQAVHDRGGTVVFVNRTAPKGGWESWKKVFDYWVEVDCDTWVQDLKSRQPLLWQYANDGKAPLAGQGKRRIERKASSGKRKRCAVDEQTGETGAMKASAAGKERPPTSGNSPKRTRISQKNRGVFHWGHPKNPIDLTGPASTGWRLGSCQNPIDLT